MGIAAWAVRIQRRREGRKVCRVDVPGEIISHSLGLRLMSSAARRARQRRFEAHDLSVGWPACFVVSRC